MRTRGTGETSGRFEPARGSSTHHCVTMSIGAERGNTLHPCVVTFVYHFFCQLPDPLALDRVAAVPARVPVDVALGADVDLLAREGEGGARPEEGGLDD